MSKFVYHKSFPEDVRGIVDAYLSPLEWMIPRWCEQVSVAWVADGEDASLSITVNFEYRFAEMNVHAAFLGCTEGVRRESCIHELIHLHVNPLFDFANRSLKILIEDEKLQEHSLDELQRYLEGTTQDLAHVVFEKLSR